MLFFTHEGSRRNAFFVRIHTFFLWFCPPLICDLTLPIDKGLGASLRLWRVKAVLEGDFSADEIIHPGDGLLTRNVRIVTDWAAVLQLGAKVDDTLQRYE